MSRYEDLKKKRNSQTQTNKVPEQSAKSRYQQLKENRGVRNYGVDDKYISTFIQDAQNFLKSSQSEFKGMSWQSATDKDKNKSRQDTWSDLNSRSATIRAYLNANKSSLDEGVYKNLTSYLDQIKSASDQTFTSFRSAEDYYSKWESEDAYNADVESWENYYAKWGHHADKDDFDSTSSNRNFVNPTDDVLSYYDAMTDSQTWRTGADGKLYDAFGNHIPYVSDEKGNIIHPMQNDSRFIVTDPLGMFLATDPDARDETVYGGEQSGSKFDVLREGVTNHWEQLKDDEISMYYYLLNTQGKDTAMEYLRDTAEKLNARWGSLKAQEISSKDSWLEKFVATGLFSIEAGLDQWSTGVAQLLNGEASPTSGVQYASSELSNSLDGLGKYAYQAGVVVGNMLPSILVSKGIGMSGLGSSIVKGAGALTMGASAGGNAYGQALKEGWSEGQARTYGVLVGASEALLEYLIGGISDLGGVGTSKILGKLSAIDNAFVRISAKLGVNIGSEIVEEELQNFLEPAFRSIIHGDDYDAPTIEEIIETAIVTALSTGVLEGGNTIVEDVAETQKYRDAGRTIMGVDGGAKALKELSDKVAGVSDVKMKNILTKQASKVSSEVATGNNLVGKAVAAVKNSSNATKVGRLYETVQKANNLANASANQADIAKSLQRKGLNAETASDIASALVAQYNGQELTKAQEKLLKSVQESEYVKEAVSNIMGNELSTMGQRSQNIRGFQNSIARGVVLNEIKEAVRKKTTDKQFAPTGKYEVSDSGKAIDAETGNEIDIKGVSSIGRGKLILELADGTTIDAKSVSFASGNDALIYEAIANLGDNISAETANKLIAKYDGSNAAVFARGMAQAYTYGFHGLDRSEMTGEDALSAELTKEQRNFAYGLGEKYRSVKDLADKAKARARKAPGKQGVYYRGKDGTATDIRSYLKQDRRVLNDMQTTGIEFMEKMSKMMGVRFNIFESWEENGTRYYLNENGKKTEGNPNGFYDPNTGEIYIDLFAGNDFQGTMLFTVAHELTHFMRQWSPEHFTKISKLVFSHAGFKGSVSSLVADKMNKSKRPLTYDAALEEVVADGMETILKDGKVAEFMADVKKSDSKVWAKLKEWFKNFADFLKKMVAAYSDESAQTVEGQKVADFSQKLLNQIEQIWAEGAVAAGENYQSSLTPGEEGTIVNENGDPVAHATEDGSVQLSMRTYEEEGRAAFRKYLEKCVKSKRMTKEEMQEMMDGIEDIYMTCKEFKDKYAPFSSWSDAAVVRDTYGKPVFSVVTPNGDYKMNLDFSLVCKKRRTLDAVFNEMSKRGIIDNFELGQKSVVKINEIIRKYGLETACALCFVDAKRFRQASMADSFTRLYNELVLSLVPEEQRSSIEHFNFAGYETIKKVENGIHTWDASKLDFSHLNEVMKNYGDGTVEYKAAKYIKSHAEGRKLLLRGDFMSSQGFDAVKTQNPDVLKLYNSKKGTGGPKAAFGDVQYLNEIIQKARFWTPKKAYAVGGVRIQSFSDYVPRMVFDYVQMVYDLAATKLPAHAYTKEALFVKQFGLTGIKINMSLIPAIAEGGIAPGLDANGNYVWAGESFDFETAKEIQNAEGYSENCGTICVGVSYQHILKLLSDPDIRMVIPYHKSGLNPIVAHMNKIAEFTDYTTLKTNPGGCQNTMDKNGNKVEVDFNFNEVLRKTGDPKATVRQYLNWCAENEYTPRFAEFAWHENYYKLIEDFTLYDKDGKYVPQREVRAVFPNESSAFGSMKSLIQEGLQEDAVIEGKRDKNLSAIVDEIQRTIPKTEAEISEDQVAQADRDLEADTKMSDRDSDGNQLSAEQQEFFKDSKVRDDNGNLIVAYHGTEKAGFTRFEVTDDIGYFFTKSIRVADTYSGGGEEFAPSKVTSWDDAVEFAEQLGVSLEKGEDGTWYLDDYPFEGEPQDAVEELLQDYLNDRANYAVYLNIKDPLIVEGNGANWDAISGSKYQDTIEVDANEGGLRLTITERASSDVIIDEEFETFDDLRAKLEERYGTEGEAVSDIMHRISYEIDEDNIEDGGYFDEPVDIDYGGYWGYERSTREWVQEAVDGGYDGVIFRNITDEGKYGRGYGPESDVYVAIDSNQIKSINNKKPTSDPDIRFSDRADESNENSPAYTGEYPNGVKFQHREDNPEKLKFLNDQIERGEYTTVYKALLKIGDSYYPPMASLEKDEKGRYTKLRGGQKLFDWIASDGKLTDEMKAKMKMKSPKAWQNKYADALSDGRNPWGMYGDFSLKKSDASGKSKGSVPAAYNPYQHSSDQVLNDQFEAAYDRPDLVVVECRIPNSELTDPYWAPYAKDPTGMHEWKTGPIAGQLKKTTRHVYMTRWIQPVRELSHSEVAQKISDIVAKESNPPRIYWNTINPNVLQELIKLGVEIDPYGSPMHINSENAKDMYGNPITDEIRAAREAEKAAKKAAKPKKTKKAKKAVSDQAVRYSERTKAPTFYSQMAKVVDGVKQEKLGAASVISMLRGKGVKAEEIKWSGIQAFLDGKKSVTKYELLEFIQGSKLQIEEEELTETVKYTDEERATLDELEAEMESNFDKIAEKWPNLFGEEMPLDLMMSDNLSTTISLKLSKNGLTNTKDGRRVMTLAKRIEGASAMIDSIARDARQNSKTARWKDYKLDGGDNYRELVFKIPGSSYTNSAMTTHWGPDAIGVLAHARMQDFDVDGKKMLFVEEIQSDWHNAGSSAGYTEGLDYSEVEDLRDRVELARSATGEAYTKWQKIEGEFGNLVVDFVRMGADNENWQRDIAAMNDRVMEARSEHERKRHEYVELANKLHELAGKVPDAPFRNNYQEFVLKRLLRMAAEEGYDSIGWTTADIQSDRWSREYAEGYRIEYDQDIPKFLKKYGKQWGATVGQTPLPGLNSTETYYDVNREETFDSFAVWQDTVRREIDQQGGDQRNVLFGMDGNDWIAYDKQTGAEYDRATVNKTSDSVWSMDITPAMKESVLTEGQPLYSYRGEKALNIDKEVLAKAKSLDKQGVPMDKIRRATGWWKQSDGKWRNEFATNEFLEPKAFNRNGLPSAIEARIAAFAEDEYMLVEPGYYSKEEADAVIQEYASRLRSKGLEFGYLSEFLDAPELYESYPHLKDIQITFDVPGLTTMAEYSNEGRGRIRLRSDYGGTGFAGREVLLHEIQHAIQAYEGFSRGTSVAAAGSFYAYSHNPGEIEANDVADRWRYSEEDRQYYEPAYFQDRTEDSVSNRSLLANAFESVAKPNEIPKIQEYKAKVALINAEEQKLRELNEQIKELSFAKGKRDTKKISELRSDATQAANRINTYDKQLLRLEASKPLQDVLEREKKRAYKKAEQRGKEALAEYKSQVLTKQKETAEKWRESRKAAVSKARETSEKRDARAKLQKLVLDTVKWISYPAKTDVKCPDILKQPYESFLQCIDLSSKRLANGGEATKNDLRLANAMGSLATALDKIMISQDPTQDVDKVLDTGYLDLPVDFVQKLRDMTENIKSMMVEGEYVVNTMTAAEVRQLSQMIRTLNHSIKTMSKLYANLRFANVEALGVDTMEFMDALGEIEKTGGMGDFVKWDNALPYYAFKRFGKGGESVFEGLMDAQDKLAFLAKEIFEFRDKAWTSKEASEWSEDTHTIELPKGGSLTLTTADAMSIYCLSRRDQGLQHLLGGGTRVLGLQKGSKKAKDSRSLLTIEDISAINSSLTDRQREVAEAIQEFMSTVCSEWGNEISMKRFLTREFTEKFYFPIESNDENLPVKDPAAQQSDLFRLLNISATKPLTPGANNEVIIRNIFDVFTGHASDMARLNAFGMGLLDYMKWLNYREKTANTEGQIKVRGVRKSMQGAYGDSAMRYVLNLVKDVNGRASDGGDPNILMKWMRAGKTASVGSSLRVATLQITSYPRAALVLSPKSLALGLTKMPNIEKAKKYCGIALWKSFGFYDTNISRSIEDQMKGVTDVKQKLIELSLKGAELGDAITWGALWNACEYEVAQTTNNKVGSEEFYQEVGKKLREVVYRTQVVDSNLTRSQIMRSKRGMAQEATAFMSETTLSANILMDAGFEFGLEKRRTGSAKAAWAKTGSYIARAVAVYSIGQLAAALMEGLWDAWRDDDDEEFGQKFLDEFIENLALDLVPFNKIPIVSDVFEGALAMFDVGFYSADKMSSAWITQALSAADAWKDVFGGKSSTTAYNAIYKTTRALSSYFGVSVSGAMREVVALWNNTAGAYDSTLKIRQYDLSEADLGVELYEALTSGNTRQADSLKAQFDDVESMQAALRKAIMDNYSSGGINRDTALRHLVEFSGMEEDDAYWKVEEWEYEKEFDDEFRKYNEFYEAVQTGKNLKAVTKEYTDHGVDAKTLASQITSYFKPLYKEMSKAERAALKGYLLNAYALLGYDRDKKSKDIDKWLED